VANFRPWLAVDLEGPHHEGDVVDEAALERIRTANWKEIAEDLLKYATAKVRRRRWRTGNREDLAKGWKANDLVNEAVKRMLAGKRQWNPEKDPDLLLYLRNVIDSLVSNLAKDKDNRLVTYIPEEAGRDPEEMLNRAPAGSPHAEYLSPTSPLIEDGITESRTATPEEESLLEEIFTAAGKNPELQSVVDAIMDGNGKPTLIATATGLDVERVYQLLRTLRRIDERRGKAMAKSDAQEKSRD